MGVLAKNKVLKLRFLFVLRFNKRDFKTLTAVKDPVSGL
jgi:hypothetical protein